MDDSLSKMFLIGNNFVMFNDTVYFTPHNVLKH